MRFSSWAQHGSRPGLRSIDGYRSRNTGAILRRAGIPLLAWYVLAILGLAAVLQWRAHPAPAFEPVLALAVGAVPVPLLFTSVIAAFLDPLWYLCAGVVVVVYTLLYLARGLHAVTGYTQRAAACAGLVFVLGFIWLTDSLDVIPDVAAIPLEGQAAEPGDAARGWRGHLVQTGRPHRCGLAGGGRPRDIAVASRPSSLGFEPASATRKCSQKKSAWRRGCSRSDTTWPPGKRVADQR